MAQLFVPAVNPVNVEDVVKVAEIYKKFLPLNANTKIVINGFTGGLPGIQALAQGYIEEWSKVIPPESLIACVSQSTVGETDAVAMYSKSLGINAIMDAPLMYTNEDGILRRVEEYKNSELEVFIYNNPSIVTEKRAHGPLESIGNISNEIYLKLLPHISGFKESNKELIEQRIEATPSEWESKLFAGSTTWYLENAEKYNGSLAGVVSGDAIFDPQLFSNLVAESNEKREHAVFKLRQYITNFHESKQKYEENVMRFLQAHIVGSLRGYVLNVLEPIQPQLSK